MIDEGFELVPALGLYKYGTGVEGKKYNKLTPRPMNVQSSP